MQIKDQNEVTYLFHEVCLKQWLLLFLSAANPRCHFIKMRKLQFLGLDIPDFTISTEAFLNKPIRDFVSFILEELKRLHPTNKDIFLALGLRLEQFEYGHAPLDLDLKDWLLPYSILIYVRLVSPRVKINIIGGESFEVLRSELTFTNLQSLKLSISTKVNVNPESFTIAGSNCEGHDICSCVGNLMVFPQTESDDEE
jgi:hypothetical protein